jgi:peptidoglycan/xylan/chitin deacetylase (PgdA/CDA1 family)
MPLWRQILSTLYYQATKVYREPWSRHACAVGRAPVSVLVFHRIADDRANGWTTSNKAFYDIIHWLQDHFDVISLEETQRRVREPANSRPGVSITFDDGYAENCALALPLLIRERIPCCYFVSAQPVLDGKIFEHDLSMGNRFVTNTVSELRDLSRAGIEIGHHTRTHPDMAQLTDEARLFDELVTSRNELQQAIGQEIRYFAFPFGRQENMSARAFHVARAAGYRALCSAYGGYNFPGDDAFHIQRRGVYGPVSATKNWVTPDPLRNRNVKRFEYQQNAPAAETITAEAYA